MTDIRTLTIRIGGPRGVVKCFAGRFAWTLLRLIEVGERGVTAFERPAPRWSHFVYILRREGVAIETIDELHAGPYGRAAWRVRVAHPHRNMGPGPDDKIDSF
jgi:hypothetical protein